MMGTQQTKTSQNVRRRSRLDIDNKDPNFDYCFRSKKDLEEGGGEDSYGYEVVGGNNSNGERSAIPYSNKTKSKKQISFLDTVLCKRNKEVSAFFKEMEDTKYNNQIKLVQDVGKRTEARLRQLDSNAKVVDQSENSFTQRSGPTTEE